MYEGILKRKYKLSKDTKNVVMRIGVEAMKPFLAVNRLFRENKLMKSYLEKHPGEKNERIADVASVSATACVFYTGARMVLGVLTGNYDFIPNPLAPNVAYADEITSDLAQTDMTLDTSAVDNAVEIPEATPVDVASEVAVDTPEVIVTPEETAVDTTVDFATADLDEPEVQPLEETQQVVVDMPEENLETTENNETIENTEEVPVAETTEENQEVAETENVQENQIEEVTENPAEKWSFNRKKYWE